MFLSTTSKYLLKTSRNGGSTTCLGRPFQCLITLLENKFFLISTWTPPYSTWGLAFKSHFHSLLLSWLSHIDSLTTGWLGLCDQMSVHCFPCSFVTSADFCLPVDYYLVLRTVASNSTSSFSMISQSFVIDTSQHGHHHISSGHFYFFVWKSC